MLTGPSTFTPLTVRNRDLYGILAVDNRLCMGLSSNPYMFSKISDFIARCAIMEGVVNLLNYLDDFGIVGSNFQDCCLQQNIIIALLWRLCFPIKRN